MAFSFISPYMPLETEVRWLRGNHHGHSVRSDGEDAPLEMIQAYEAAGYDYLALSEHDLFVAPAEYQGRTSMTILPAVEVTSRDGQTLMYLGAGPNIPVAQTHSLPELADRIAAAGGLFVVDHPNWLYKPMRRHASVEEILAAPAVTAIEIYTGVIERLPGNPYATDVWDALLSAGRKVFGHAVDDQHCAVDRFLGWNCVEWPADEAVSAAGVIAALRHGRFYASTGVTLSRLGLTPDGQEIVIESDATRIAWILRDGVVADVTEGGQGRFALSCLPGLPRLRRSWKRDATLKQIIYLRAELMGDGGRRAWTQPFFVATP